MRLSISNIAWDAADDLSMYEYLFSRGVAGLEIAPTRILPDQPYTHIPEAIAFANEVKTKYSLTISSMQSIWYNRSESIFGSDAERQFLLDYTCQAILFAKAIGCGNLVFGCPRNRNLPGEEMRPKAYPFFRQIGEFAKEHGVVIALEPNPPIYNTNFMNTVEEAVQFCREVNSDGLMVNWDLGTSIYYQDSIEYIAENIDVIHHIHISEPYLARIESRDIHRQISRLDYDKWISIEMKNPGNIRDVQSTIDYVLEVFS